MSHSVSTALADGKNCRQILLLLCFESLDFLGKEFNKDHHEFEAVSTKNPYIALCKASYLGCAE